MFRFLGDYPLNDYLNGCIVRAYVKVGGGQMTKHRG